MQTTMWSYNNCGFHDFAAWSCYWLLQEKQTTADYKSTWVCYGWIWKICPGAADHSFFCHQLLWYALNTKVFSFPCITVRILTKKVHSGTANNAGAILVVGRGLVIVPKLIHPLPPPLQSPETSPERVMEDTWMQVLILLYFFLFEQTFYFTIVILFPTEVYL